MDLSPTTRFQIVKSDVLGTHKNTATDFSELANGHITNTNGFNDDLNKLDFTPTTDGTLQINKGNCFVKYIIDERVGRARFEIVNDLNEDISSLPDGDYFVYIELNTSILIAGSSDVDGQDVGTLKIDITEPTSGFYYSLYKVNKNSGDITLIEDLREKRKLNVDSVNQQETNLALKDLNDVDDNLNPISGDVFYNNGTERKSKQFDDLFDENIAVQELTNKDFYIGHNGVKGKSVFIEENITTTEADTAQNIGDVTGNTRVAFRQFGDGVEGNTFKVNLAVQGSPSVALNFRIETDDNGQPSGNLVNANSTASIGSGGLTGTLTETTLTLGGNITISEGTPVWIVGYQGTYGSETVNGSNYYQIGHSTNQTSTRIKTTYNGTEYTSNLYFDTLKPSSASFRDSSVDFYLEDGTQSLDVNSLGNYNYSNTCIKWSNYTARVPNGSFITETSTQFTLFFDANNYASCKYDSGDTTLTIMSGGSVVHNVSFSGTGSDLKMEYDGTDVKIYDWNGSARNQLSSYTITFAGNYEIRYHGQVSESGSSSNRGISEATNFFFTNFFYTTQDPATPNDFIYFSSDLVKDKLLSYTDASKLYKLSFFGILKGNYQLGNNALCGFYGMNNDLTGLTKGKLMYLSDNEGELSETKGTNEIKVGVCYSQNSIYLFNVYENLFTKYKPGDTTISIASNNVSITSNTTETKIKEFQISKEGTVRMYIRGYGAGGRYKIYKNGIARSGEVQKNSGNFIDNVDIPVLQGDLLQLYGYTTSASGARFYVYNCELRIERPYKLPQELALLD